MQNISFNYSQQLTRLYEVGTTAVYFVVGRAAGQASVARVIGPTRLNLAFIRQFADACQAANNNPIFTGNLGCSDSNVGNRTSWKLQGCVLTTIAVAVSAQDMLINEQLGLTFVALDIVERT